MMTATMSQSFATEPGDFTNYLRGATQGLPLGALPPPGLYGGFGLNATGLGGTAGQGNQNIPTAGTAPAFGYGFNLLWVPGWNFLGATYAFGIVQGFYQAETANQINPPFTAGMTISPEIANTNFTPIDLSWNLGHGWFSALALNVVGPDGSRWPSTAAGAGAVDLNPDYWTLAPAWAISYLDANWTLSANFRYDINFASAGVTMTPFIPAAARNGFVSGNLLFGDLTALYKVGKWEFGPVAYFVTQTTADQPGGGVPCTFGPGGICGRQSQVDVGFLVGYDFGPVKVQIWADDSVECHDCIGYGWDVWRRSRWLPRTEAGKELTSAQHNRAVSCSRREGPAVTAGPFASTWITRCVAALAGEPTLFSRLMPVW
jgi:hypothetical protein